MLSGRDTCFYNGCTGSAETAILINTRQKRREHFFSLCDNEIHENAALVDRSWDTIAQDEWDGELLYSREQRVMKRKESNAPERLDRDGKAPRLIPRYFINVGAF